MNMHSRLSERNAGAAAIRDAPMPYRLQIARSLTDIVRLAPAWRALEQKVSGAGFFQTYEWCRNCAEHDVLHGETEFFVCAVFDVDEMVAVLPLRVQQKTLRSTLTGLGEPFQQYTEMLVADGHDPQMLFEPIRAALAGSGADFVYLAQVRADGPLEKALDNRVPATGEEKGAPYVPLADWPDFDSYFKSLNAKSRKNMRNLRNKLGRVGQIEHQVAFAGPVLEQVISNTFEGRIEWLERMGLTSRAFRNAGFAQFLDRFRGGADSGINIVAMRLTLDGHPIAEQWGFVHAGRYYAYISTWDTTYQEYSPGRLHLEDVLRACSAMGVEVADFLVPAAAYKLTFASGVMPVHDYVLPLNLRGHLYGSVWVKHLRPLAKKAAYAIPTGLRRAIFGRLFGQADS